MDFVANGLLATGGTPLMSESIDELRELLSISQALYINIGTLDNAFIDRALTAAEIAHSLQKPVILDPVGAGASKLRTEAALKLLNYAHVIRGNASEIIALSGSIKTTKGVEAVHAVQSAVSNAKTLALTLNKIIVVSGPQDFITDGQQSTTLDYGSYLMPLVTGMGCTMTAVLSAFVADDSDYFTAALHATAYFGLCGQLTQEKTKAPGTFKQQFIDSLYQPDWTFFERALAQ